jgi:hypothetical protein
MSTDRSDPFVEFAVRCGLRISTIELPAVPRDVLAPPAELQWHTLMTLVGASASAIPIRTLFVTEASDSRPPGMRDLLWWLSSDCWALERADRNYERWAATYRYPTNDSATRRLFRVQIEQALALVGFLGEEAYRQLLALYAAELKPGEPHPNANVEHAKRSWR